MQTYQQTIDYLYALLPVFQREGQSAYKPGLANTIRLNDYFAHPYRRYRTIHVAGTNGKGSVSHILASVLQHAGYKVGLYTSPHLKDFRERIRINGKPVAEDYVCRFVDEHKTFFEANDFSFFEVTMTMAFKYFADEAVDIAVIETGLGGRLDSTNIIHPILSVITNISFDHINLLGNTIQSIAKEKAGIIKAHTPVVIGEAGEEERGIFEAQAAAVQAPIIFAQEETSISDWENRAEKIHFSTNEYPDLQLDLQGDYQQKNATTALTAIRILKEIDLKIGDEALRKGLASVVATTGLQGRWQKLHDKPLVLCDTGHNEAGIRFIVRQLQRYPYKHLHFVLGMVNDKDVNTILSLLPTDATYYFAKASVMRALPADHLKHLAARYGLQGEPFASVPAALQAAQEQATPHDLIFVGGSTFVVADALL